MRVVWPTSRGWVLLIGSLLWFLVALVNQKPLPALFATGGLALALASFFSTLMSLQNLRVTRGAVGDAATGNAVHMPLVVENLSRRRRQDIVVRENCPFATESLHTVVVPSLSRLESRLVNRRILAMKRGEFDLGDVVLRGGDPAGLFYRESVFHLPRRALIVPGTEPLTSLNLQPRPNMSGATGTPLSIAGTSQEFYGIREYNPTDGLRHIHWKSSARFRRLMVREFERNAVTSAAILVDANRRFVSGNQQWSNLEYQIRAAASIAQHLSSLYCQVAFAAGGARPLIMPFQAASQALPTILYELAVLEQGNVSLPEVAYELGARLEAGTIVFCLSLSTSKPVSDALQILSERGLIIRWLCADRKAFAPQPWRNRPATRRTARRLRDLPFPVVDLHPDRSLAGALAHAD